MDRKQCSSKPRSKSCRPHKNGQTELLRVRGRQLGAGYHGGQCVEDVLLQILDHFVRQRAAPCSAHIVAQFGHDRAGERRFRVYGPYSSGRQCRRSDHPTRTLQDATPG